jgi:hypothetical protein
MHEDIGYALHNNSNQLLLIMLDFIGCNLIITLIITKAPYTLFGKPEDERQLERSRGRWRVILK